MGSRLTGRIPSEIGTLSQLVTLSLVNLSTNGSIPDELYLNLSQLEGLFLENCGLSGTISSNIGLLEELWHLSLTGNNFQGELPSEIGELVLNKLLLNNNAFTGSVPDSICAAVGVAQVEAGNYEISADCAPGEAMIECLCCSQCCSSQTKVCSQM